ncbi:hypothetical protein Amsp01_040440 [Amycolatopsis sp. NBRC 101858]|uniref:hypothetical protein n=1 Tax=Amycolatopsis sp. NBRC 101858 TaxID=3032200 RepID=UPI0024A08840|nr:hypothetical protein [Amycolatopsis sp. NBRC 101858]GLY38020.1 hypothetical protein Amsp01_040440 [Amycolatopsis sp. NBRC 101858]
MTEIDDRAFTAAARSTRQGGYWSHFAPGDRVLVFGEPDPVNGRRRVRRGTVLEPPSPDVIRIGFGDEEYGEFSSADPVRVNHVAGTCPCVVVLS